MRIVFCNPIRRDFTVRRSLVVIVFSTRTAKSHYNETCTWPRGSSAHRTADRARNRHSVLTVNYRLPMRAYGPLVHVPTMMTKHPSRSHHCQPLGYGAVGSCTHGLGRWSLDDDRSTIVFIRSEVSPNPTRGFGNSQYTSEVRKFSFQG